MNTDYRAFITKITDLEKDVSNSLDHIEWKNQISNDSLVFVKPNFTYPFHKPGITTTPELLEILLAKLKDRADRVIIGESDGGNHSFSADDGFKGHNMYKICSNTGTELVNLSKIPATYVEDKILNKKVKVQVPDILINDVDCFISVPVLKVHAMTTITLSMKNLWGCYPDTMRGLYHKNLAYKLTLLTKLLKPQIIVIDGINALNKHGPMHGEAVKSDLLISANNPVVADSLGTSLMGFQVNDIEHIKIAEREGLGTTELNEVRFNQDWKQYQMKFSVNRTLIDSVSILPFNSECMAKIVMDSPIKPIIYGIATKLKNKDEEVVNQDLKRVSK
ncbi:DUF362 domain-containing protein [Methanomicrobium antiquum]|uniref:DUF362 domain-containing protein n=1 Tax=Methanomicrobium antiquum TaxID=487686 RepID=A0AAF0FZL6_9EURY|nr:DUF362 domain-containing protein [Methanomicrobium antiquum]WFN37399.1 DUF362 domain-containing protein [Methanomicrobium antiquum]